MSVWRRAVGFGATALCLLLLAACLRSAPLLPAALAALLCGQLALMLRRPQWAWTVLPIAAAGVQVTPLTGLQLLTPFDALLLTTVAALALRDAMASNAPVRIADLRPPRRLWPWLALLALALIALFDGGSSSAVAQLAAGVQPSPGLAATPLTATARLPAAAPRAAMAATPAPLGLSAAAMATLLLVKPWLLALALAPFMVAGLRAKGAAALRLTVVGLAWANVPVLVRVGFDLHAALDPALAMAVDQASAQASSLAWLLVTAPAAWAVALGAASPAAEGSRRAAPAAQRPLTAGRAAAAVLAVLASMALVITGGAAGWAAVWAAMALSAWLLWVSLPGRVVWLQALALAAVFPVAVHGGLWPAAFCALLLVLAWLARAPMAQALRPTLAAAPAGGRKLAVALGAAVGAVELMVAGAPWSATSASPGWTGQAWAWQIGPWQAWGWPVPVGPLAGACTAAVACALACAITLLALMRWPRRLLALLCLAMLAALALCAVVAAALAAGPWSALCAAGVASIACLQAGTVGRGAPPGSRHPVQAGSAWTAAILLGIAVAAGARAIAPAPAPAPAATTAPASATVRFVAEPGSADRWMALAAGPGNHLPTSSSPPAPAAQVARVAQVVLLPAGSANAPLRLRLLLRAAVIPAAAGRRNAGEHDVGPHDVGPHDVGRAERSLAAAAPLTPRLQASLCPRAASPMSACATATLVAGHRNALPDPLLNLSRGEPAGAAALIASQAAEAVEHRADLSAWQPVEAVLQPPENAPETAGAVVLALHAPREGMPAVDVDEVRLLDAQEHDLLSNGDFDAGAARWRVIAGEAGDRLSLPVHGALAWAIGLTLALCWSWALARLLRLYRRASGTPLAAPVGAMVAALVAVPLLAALAPAQAVALSGDTALQWVLLSVMWMAMFQQVRRVNRAAPLA